MVLKYIPREKYGCDAIISIPFGLNYNDFFKAIPMLENNLGATVVSNLSPEGNSIYIRVAYSLDNADKEDIIKFNWYKTMQSDTKFINNGKGTFYLQDIKLNEHFGFDLKVVIPVGLSYEDLLKSKSMLENIYKAQIFIQWDSYHNVAKLRVVDVKDDKLPYVYWVELKWYKMIASLSSPNNYVNDNYETFKITKIVKQDVYGFDCEVIMPTGIAYDRLESILNTIETTYQAHIYMEQDKFNGKALLKVITKPIDDKVKFGVVKTQPFCLYFGMTHYYEQMIANLTDFPHVLITGATGTGKSVAMQIAITNEMYIRPSTDFYFAQLTDKQDFEDFRNCKSTKCITTTVSGVFKMFKTLLNIQKQRNELLIKEGVKNIILYNQKAKNKMNAIIVAIDEMPEFMPKTEKIDGSEHDYKLKIQEMMNKLVKQARNIGLFFIVGIQRPDLNDMLPNMKANFRIKIAFAQENSPSSKVVCDNDDAVGLPKREALYMVGSQRKRFKTLYFTSDTIKQLLKDRMDENHKLIDFDGNEKVTEEKENTFVKKVDNSDEQKTSKATSRIKINKGKGKSNEVGES